MEGCLTRCPVGLLALGVGTHPERASRDPANRAQIRLNPTTNITCIPSLGQFMEQSVQVPAWDRFVLYVDRSGRNFPWRIRWLAYLLRPITLIVLGFVLAPAFLWHWIRRWFGSTQSPPPSTPTGAPWDFVNHSTPRITWSEVGNEPHDRTLLASIRETLLQWPSIGSPDWYGIDRLCETNATHNFRIVPGVFSDPIMLRLHTGTVSELRVRNDQHVREWLVAQAIFSPSPVAHCLQPLSTNDRSTYANVNFEIAPARYPDPAIVAHFAECFPYAHGVSHYSAPSKKQIVSFAQLFGKLQAAFQHMDRSLLPPVSDEDKQPYWSSPETLERYLKMENDYCLAYRRVGSPPGVVNLWRSNEKLIFDWLEKCCDFWAKTIDEQRLVLLHDVHTHNAFFIGEECVLIYDYHWIADWRHADVVVYSLHRFVREAVREKIGRRDPSATKQIAELSSDFLTAYGLHGPKLECNVKDTLDLRIASACLFKLGTVMARRIQALEEESDRPQAFLDQEVYKFITFLKEASFFRS